MTQILPKDQDFAPTAFTTSPSSIAMYYHIEPAPGSAENQYSYAQLHDGYYEVFGAQGGAACTRGSLPATGPAATNAGVAYVHRQPFQADQRVIGRFGMSFAAGATFTSTAIEQFLENSVFARVQGGTLVGDGTTACRWTNVTGYQLQLRGTGGPPFTALEWRLVRWNGGVRTLIAKEEFGFPFSTIRPEPLFLFGISILCEDNAGDVEITCKWRSFTFTSTTGIPAVGIPPGGAKSISNFTMFSSLAFTLSLPAGWTHDAGTGKFTDASAGKITGPGHCGFAMGRDRDYGSSLFAVDYISRFTVENPAGTRLLRDTFTTGGPTALPTDVARTIQPKYQIPQGSSVSQLLNTDSFGVQGWSLQTEWNGDEYSQSAVRRDLQIDTASARAFTAPGGGSTATYNSLYSQRPPTDLYLQHRSVDIEFEGGTGGSSFRSAGMCFFGNGAADDGTVFGFFLQDFYKVRVLLADGTGAFTLLVDRDSPTLSAEIASKDFTGTLSVGTGFNLDVQIWHPDLAPSSTGPVNIQVKINGAAVTSWDSVHPDYTDIGSGILEDANTSRRNSGFEGLYSSIIDSSTTGRRIFFDDWTEEVFTDPNQPPGADEIGIVVADEGTAVGTFTAPIDFRFEQISRSFRERTIFDSGHTASRSVLPDRKSWRGGQSGASQAELDYVVGFWDSHLGPEIPFNFTPPGYSTQYKVHFVGDSLRYQRIGVDTYRVAFDIEELV